MARTKKDSYLLTDKELVNRSRQIMRRALAALDELGTLPGRDCIYLAHYDPLLQKGMNKVRDELRNLLEKKG